MVKKADIPDHVIKSALSLAGDEGWDAVTLPRLAEAAKLPLTDVHRIAPDRRAVLEGVGRLVDEAALSEGVVDPAEPARDRLFEVMMRRFDVLQDHRAGVLAILDGLRRDPLSAFCQGPALERSMGLMLDLAAMPATGLIGVAKVRVLTLIYLDMVRTWRRDDTDDMAKTMKALDKRLDQAEQLANTFEHGRRPRRGGKAAAPPDQADDGGSENQAADAG